MSQHRSDVDAATIEVIRNYLTSAATEMQRTLVRTAYNAIVYEILDFGISIYDRDLNLIADSPGLALFLGANDFGLENAVEHLGEENLDPGDIVMMNYPYWSGTHTLDVLVFAPVFHDGELVGYTTCRAHWLDLGAKDSGYVLDSTDVHQEGLIFPGTKVYKGGEPDEEILELVRFNTRLPDKVIGDLNAQFAALNTGKRRLTELYEKYGSATVDAAIDEVLDHGERTARAAVSDLPDGTWSAVDYADGALGSDRGPETEDLIRLEAAVTVAGDDFTVDFSDSEDEVNEPLNIPLGMTETISKLCFKAVTTPEEDSNAGQYEPLETVAPEGNIFHATYPAPTFTIWTAILGIDVIFKALAKAVPEMVPSSSGGDLLSIMVYGENPETGHQFVEANNEGIGWGGAPTHDGANGLMHISESMVQNVPVEVYENKAPLEIDRLTLRQDSGGAGEFRGGLGIRRDYTFTHPVGALSIIQKTKTDNWALDGGKPGARNAVVLHPGTDREERTGMMRETFDAGEGLSNRAGGGAGRGNPFDRDPVKVREDVLDEYVSREAAREEYGVVITEDGQIDEEATEKLRS